MFTIILNAVTTMSVVMVVVVSSGVGIVFLADLTRGLIKKSAIDYIEFLQRLSAAKFDAQKRETEAKNFEAHSIYKIRAARRQLLKNLE